MDQNDRNILLSKGFLFGLTILILNDNYFKYHFPGFVTGKLSDIAGLYIFPMFLSAIIKKNQTQFYWLTFIGFIIWKLPISDIVITEWNNLNLYRISRVNDYSDYLALAVLPLSYHYQPKETLFSNRMFVSNSICIASIFAFCSTAGTHGSIKSYGYAVSKESLEKAINEVINEDRLTLFRPPLDTLGSNSINDNYHNKDGYITLHISSPKKYEYIFRFYGGEEEWKNSPNYSQIFICYAWDDENKGGSEGVGGLEWYRFGLKDKLIEYFEENFIAKIDKKLQMGHSEEE